MSYVYTLILLFQMLVSHIMAPHLPLEVSYARGSQSAPTVLNIAQPVSCDGWEAPSPATHCYSVWISLYL